ncbi:MAG: DUF4202 family protein [Pseudomonadota bacterium]|nr:DUF4202 family protein [Pseudomonadota bacterium]
MDENAGKSGLDYYQSVKEFVETSFAVVDNQLVPLHLERTVNWLLELYPEADEALLIAGISHDIERAFREEKVYRKMFNSDSGFLDSSFLDYHQQRSAKIIFDFLQSLNCPTAMSKKVFHLVSHHETGGDFETDLLKDADSLSFFQTNVDLFVTIKVKESSVDKVKNKFIWMFERISTLKAKDICSSFYQDAMARLARLEN